MGSVGVLYRRLAGQIHYAIVLLLLIVGLWQLQHWLQQATTMPIKHVRIEGELRHVSKEAVAESLAELVETGYFAMDSEAILSQLTELEWVADARIRRVWPDTMVLSFDEQKPVAVWNEKQLLNELGEVFQPELTPALLALPHLTGGAEQNRAILAEQQRIDSAIKELGLSVSNLDLAKHGSWTVVLSNGVKVKAGKQQPTQKISKSLALLASLDGDLLAYIETIDLRYPNGVSVAWREGYQLAKSKGQSAVFTLKEQRRVKG